ncbi:MAG: asparagine--tRNA ligase [Candidatus Hydrothermarchaeota archaeon]|nr:MAG: asparagine--tRNA ligase [Candidatus Hydrothermarchaeota archaeon]
MKEKYISIKEALEKKKGKVSLRGWVYRERKFKDKVFIVLRDHSGIIQTVIHKDKVSEKEWEQAERILIESSVKLHGELVEDPRAPGGVELRVEKFELVHLAEPFPITKDKSKEYLYDKRHLWLRSRYLTSILKIRSTVFRAIREYFWSKGFYEFHSPSLTPGVAEEGPTLFEVNYFGKKLYLTQTWQLYAEAAIFALEKIFTIAPSFRAERSKTSRHLAEYWHAEVEVAWMNMDELMDLAEEMIKHVIREVLKHHREDLEFLGRNPKDLERVLEKKWPRITYDEALEILEKKGMKVPWGKDLRTIEEDKLMEDFDTPVFVTHYPKEIMAFYKPRDPKNPKVARCFDLIAPEGYGELIGGSERDENIDELIKALKKAGENIENYEFYLDTRRYGSIPHSGFGMGVERLISWICKLETIRDAIPFPRTMTRYKP